MKEGNELSRKSRARDSVRDRVKKLKSRIFTLAQRTHRYCNTYTFFSFLAVFGREEINIIYPEEVTAEEGDIFFV